MSSSKKMRFFIVRHGSASHLLENLNRKLNRNEFIHLLEQWKKATLTPIGEREIAAQVEKLNNDYSFLYYSPLKRTKQTAISFMKAQEEEIHSEALPELTEIYISPPRIHLKCKIKLKYWIALCVLRSLYTMKILLYLRQARSIIKSIKQANTNVLIVSHQARIITIIMYCLASPRWRVVKTDFNPAGVSIVEKR